MAPRSIVIIRRYIAVLSAGCVFYFWGAWTVHSLLDDARPLGDRDDTPLLPTTRNNAVSSPDEPSLVVNPNPPAPSSNYTFSRGDRGDTLLPARNVSSPDEPVLVANSNPPTPVSNDTFSACLLVMDDNHFMIEWLAYHYHTLPLKHLIVAVDPRSKTSPTPILDRWRDHGMDIIQWNDTDFMPPKDLKREEKRVRGTFGDIPPDLVRHRARQRLFYFGCMQKLKNQGRHWTLLIDSDEYLFVNYPTVAARNLTAPPANQTGSVMSFLQEELQRPGHNLTTPCVQIPRIRFGSKESGAVDVKRHVPVGFNASSFQTLRWRKHASNENGSANKISKTMIDLSRVAWKDLKPVDSVHRPIKSICGQRGLYIRMADQVFAIHHYLGTWEQFSYRDDSRSGDQRSNQTYKKLGNVDQGSDDDIRPWLAGFVQEKGSVAAKALLAGVGELE